MRADKITIATVTAIILHLVGFIGILFIDRDRFAAVTFYHLLIMFGLLIYTQERITKGFIAFMLICIVTGFAVELLGTKTGWLFGNYTYGKTLGPAIEGVPVIIGINWFVIIYCCGITIQRMLIRISEQVSKETGRPRKPLRTIAIVADGALLAVLFDWLMEPVAINLDYWNWAGGDEVPFFNYLSWFLVSSLLMAVFHYMSFYKQNRFAVNLLLTQMMFFLLLRTIL